MEQPLLSVRELSKSYGGHRVLSGATFDLARGEALAVIGENGAGKSTLAKIIAGVVEPDAGEIHASGVQLHLSSPRDAEKAGIAMIPQELIYFRDLTVAENICAGRYPGRFGLTSQRAMNQFASEHMARYGVTIPPTERMRHLSIASRQLVEIVRALSIESPIILLDEPTATLNDAESEDLHRILKRLTGEGVGVLYISHRMDEVYRFSDRVLVLRNGESVAMLATRETTAGELVTHMLGRQAVSVSTSADQQAHRPDALTVANWRRSRFPQLNDLSLTVGSGEVVAVFGRRGSGHEVVAEGLAGRRRDIDGTVVIYGSSTPVFRNPVDARRAGIGYVPAERKTEGLVLIHSVMTNLTLPLLRRFSTRGVILPRREQRIAQRLAAEYDVRYSRLDQPVSRLSGGNQQKVLLASRLAAKPRIMVMHEPTRGVDVGARVAIHALVRRVAAEGTAVLVVTSDVEEAVNVSDRLLVIRDGQVVAELSSNERTQANALTVAGRVA